MRKLYWYLSAYIKKHGLVFVGSIIFALIVFSYFIPLIVRIIERKPRHFIGVVGEYTLSSMPRTIQKQLSAGLTELEADGTISPLLAERWIIEDGGTTYRFVLKKDIFWQDGKRITPDDVDYNFANVEEITTPHDVVFKLTDPFVPFPSVVSQPLLRTSKEKHLLFFSRNTLIGIGPNRLVDYSTQGQRLTEAVIDTPKERLVYRFYLTENDAVLAFKKGEVDVLPDLLSLHDLADWQNVDTTTTLHHERYLAVFFNNADPKFNKNVRQALSYATTKPTDGTRAIGPVNPLSWAYLESGKEYAKDNSRGIERLLDTLPPAPLNIELTTTSTFATQAEQIKAEWEEFGAQAYQACLDSKDVKDKTPCENIHITVSVKITNFPDTNNFQALLIGQEIPSDPDQYSLWHSEQSTNFSHYKNTRIDALLEKGRTTADVNERRAIYQEFQQFFLEDAPAIFIKHLESYEVKRK